MLCTKGGLYKRHLTLVNPAYTHTRSSTIGGRGLRGTQPWPAAYLNVGSAAFSDQRTRTSSAAGKQAREADTQATMTAPGDTFDVIVVGGGISGRRICPELTPPRRTDIYGRKMRRMRGEKRDNCCTESLIPRETNGLHLLFPPPAPPPLYLRSTEG